MNEAIQQARLKNKMKNPAIALVLGLVIPGAAQMYAGNVMWGIINLVIATVCMLTVIASPISFIIWLVSIYLGYKGTVAYNDAVLDTVEAAVSK
ncbi:hypothetical protein [Enterovibrio sp. FF113]|uniref:hypothetical protein n=1 Tax=Enterovibrio sp. FF113 TaxID=3230010 RepID=UPI00352FEB8A